jgi:hypothetical protein
VILIDNVLPKNKMSDSNKELDKTKPQSIERENNDK